jgi:hypothetical protein
MDRVCVKLNNRESSTSDVLIGSRSATEAACGDVSRERNNFLYWVALFVDLNRVFIREICVPFAVLRAAPLPGV